VFCAGLDILELYNAEGDRQNEFWTAFQDVWLGLYGSSYTTVAAINVSNKTIKNKSNQNFKKYTREQNFSFLKI
jgi:hypothetical protein